MLSPHTDFCAHPEQLYGILFSFLLWKAGSFSVEEALLLWKLIKIPLTYRATLVAQSLLKHLPFGFQPRYLNAHHWRYLQREWALTLCTAPCMCEQCAGAVQPCSKRQPSAPLEIQQRQSSNPGCWFRKQQMLLYAPVLCFRAISRRGSRKPSVLSKTSFEVCARVHRCTCTCTFAKRSGGIWVWFNSQQLLRGQQASQLSGAARSPFRFTLQRHIRSQAGDVNSLIKQKSMPKAH